MSYSKKEALELWVHEMGDKEYSYDFTGRKIKREDYLEKNQVGWVISFVKPLSLGGKSTADNVVILHHLTEEEKGDHFPIFTAKSRKYEIKYDKGHDFYYIERIIEEDDEDKYFI